MLVIVLIHSVPWVMIQTTILSVHQEILLALFLHLVVEEEVDDECQLMIVLMEIIHQVIMMEAVERIQHHDD